MRIGAGAGTHPSAPATGGAAAGRSAFNGSSRPEAKTGTALFLAGLSGRPCAGFFSHGWPRMNADRDLGLKDHALGETGSNLFLTAAPAARSRAGSLDKGLAIDFPAMTDPDHEDCQHFVLNLVDHSINTHPNPSQASKFSLEHTASGRLGPESVDRRNDARAIVAADALQRFQCTALNRDGVGHP